MIKLTFLHMHIVSFLQVLVEKGDMKNMLPFIEDSTSIDDTTVCMYDDL